jgi:hypothetical protein
MVAVMALKGGTAMESIKVLAVLGKACVNADWCEAFFANPETVARQLVGSLNENELAQILDLGGLGVIPESKERQAFIAEVKQKLGGIHTILTCPDRPCPREGD